MAFQIGDICLVLDSDYTKVKQVSGTLVEILERKRTKYAVQYLADPNVVDLLDKKELQLLISKPTIEDIVLSEQQKDELRRNKEYHKPVGMPKYNKGQKLLDKNYYTELIILEVSATEDIIDNKFMYFVQMPSAKNGYFYEILTEKHLDTHYIKG